MIVYRLYVFVITVPTDVPDDVHKDKAECDAARVRLAKARNKAESSEAAATYYADSRRLCEPRLKTVAEYIKEAADAAKAYTDSQDKIHKDEAECNAARERLANLKVKAETAEAVAACYRHRTRMNNARLKYRREVADASMAAHAKRRKCNKEAIKAARANNANN